MKKTVLIITTLVMFAGCFGKSVKVPKFVKETGIYIETDIKPQARFEEAKIKSVAVVRFDARDVKTRGGEIIDYVTLSQKFTDDLIEKIYTLKKIDVALGEYENKIVETDTLERKRGDLEISGNTIQRSVEYIVNPYKKVQAVLRGKILKYQEGEDWERSFIEVSIRLTDNYTGSLYWITKMRGYVKDVIATIALTLSEGKYTEPIPVKKVIKKEEKKKK